MPVCDDLLLGPSPYMLFLRLLPFMASRPRRMRPIRPIPREAQANTLKYHSSRPQNVTSVVINGLGCEKDEDGDQEYNEEGCQLLEEWVCDNC
jgi:hypothetical protein